MTTLDDLINTKIAERREKAERERQEHAAEIAQQRTAFLNAIGAKFPNVWPLLGGKTDLVRDDGEDLTFAYSFTVDGHVFLLERSDLWFSLNEIDIKGETAGYWIVEDESDLLNVFASLREQQAEPRPKLTPEHLQAEIYDAIMKLGGGETAAAMAVLERVHAALESEVGE